MAVEILEIKAFVVFSPAIASLHLPDPAPGDAGLSAVAAKHRAETRWRTSAVSRVCPPRFRDDGKNEQAQDPTEVRHLHGNATDCRPFSCTTVSTRVIRLSIANRSAGIPGLDSTEIASFDAVGPWLFAWTTRKTDEKRERTLSSHSGFPIQGAYSVSRFGVGQRCRSVSQALGSATMAEPMLRRTDRQTDCQPSSPPIHQSTNQTTNQPTNPPTN